MSDSENCELDEKLLEFSNWQIEQQKKLKMFQEAQRKLLDSEHEKLLTSLKTQNYEWRHAISESDEHCADVLKMEEEDSLVKIKTMDEVFSYDSNAIKLKDPNISLCGAPMYVESEKADEMENSSQDYEKDEMMKPRRFLRRGEGLARYRMTADDFKTPPNIYKEKKIKTYLNQKPGLNRKKMQVRAVKSANDGVKRKSNAACKSKSVPVSIYVSEDKNKKSPPVRNACDAKVSKMSCPKNKELPVSKAPVRNLLLKPAFPPFCAISSYEKAKTGNAMSDTSQERNTIEKAMKKDERELQMFEMLEGKIGEGSLSPNSSLVARFMEESLCSTPSKSEMEDGESEIASFREGLRALQMRYLPAEQMERIKESEEEFLNKEIPSNHNAKCDEELSESSECSLTALDFTDEERIDEIHDKEFDELEFSSKNGDEERERYRTLPEEPSRDVTPLLPQSKKASKTLLQEYIENFKKLKSAVKEGGYSDIDDISQKTAEENMPDNVSDQALSQREIAIKLQRKALQDNVKTLLNWEGSSRKRQPKKSVNKLKGKPCKLEKGKKLEGDDADKITLSNELIRGRMAELEKEIEIFQKENKALNQMQRELETELAKLEKERKEFEKHMEQERKQFEARMNEEQKKLQREKSVFDKYCKQARNQPNKKERDEIANLKKELEKLTESMATKEARWGASQARLRNQIKMLEKGNAELKSELDKLKQQNTKKVTFRSGKNVNTKIIHAINAELGKLKPHLAKPGTAKEKIGSQSATVNSNSHKPMRRIKSVPNLKCQSGDSDVRNAGSLPEPNETENKLSYIAKESMKPEVSVSFRPSGHDLEKNSDLADSPPTKDGSRMDSSVDSEESVDEEQSGAEESPLESVLREVYFDLAPLKKNGKVPEIRKRLKELRLLEEPDSHVGSGEGNRLNSNEQTENSSEGDENDAGVKKNSPKREDLDFERCRSSFARCSPTCEYCLPKLDPRGTREKTHEDGRKEIFYANGNVKKISADKRIVKMFYYNGDLKENDMADGTEKYYYAETKTWHTTYKNGMELLEFSNGQIERRHPNGATEIVFPNGCIRYSDPTGKDEWRFLDGTVIKTDENGHKVLLLPNGQKEIHTHEYKRREYPDGTVKLLYSNGSQETRYSNGRVRLRDCDGKLIMDSGGVQ